MEHNDESNLTESLPALRCTPRMKADLQKIARNSVARNMSDHVRYALELYISAQTDDVEDLPQPERVPA